MPVGNALEADWAGVDGGWTRVRTLAREQKEEQEWRRRVKEGMEEGADRRGAV